MKKLTAIILAILMVLSLAACNGMDGGNTPANEQSNSGAENSPAITTPSGNDDPCPCCPNCIQKECKCADCGDSDDCECKSPGGGSGPYTFEVTLDSYIKGDFGASMVYRTFGEATVTLEQVDASGKYSGIADGHGKYSDWGTSSQNTLLELETGYDFTVQLSNYDPFASDSITIGISRFCSEVETTTPVDPNSTFYGQNIEKPGWLVFFYTTYRTDFFDEDTRLFTFELPMKNGEASEIYLWEEAAMHVGLIINITPVK